MSNNLKPLKRLGTQQPQAPQAQTPQAVPGAGGGAPRRPMPQTSADLGKKTSDRYHWRLESAAASQS